MAAFARAIGQGETTVRNWFLRGSIPAWHDRKIIQAAEDAGRKITHDDLFALRESLFRERGDAA